MNQQKGFSLIEVLVSLVLASSVVIALFEQQLEIQQILSQLILRAGASQWLDTIDENRLLNRAFLPAPPQPYQFHATYLGDSQELQMAWSASPSSLIHRYYSLKKT